jgi:hypothetical protein
MSFSLLDQSSNVPVTKTSSAGCSLSAILVSNDSINCTTMIASRVISRAVVVFREAVYATEQEMMAIRDDNGETVPILSRVEEITETTCSMH